MDVSNLHPNNFPNDLTPFVGRRPEIARLENWLADNALIVLLGPAGVGKTRLALQVAATQLPRFTAGVFHISLAGIRQPETAAMVIAQTIQAVSPGTTNVLDVLQRYLKDRQVLLILDDFELGVGAATLLPALLEASANLRLMVISREMLQLPGQLALVLEPLELPDVKNLAGKGGLAQYARQFSASNLLVDRLSKVSPTFQLTDDNAGTIVALSARLLGLPLALELVAARASRLPLAQILEQINLQFSHLAPKRDQAATRQQILDGVLEWSLGLAALDERQLLERLSILAGEFSVEVAGAVCVDTEAERQGLPARLESLVRQGLLRATGSLDKRRYFMPEAIHQYTRKRFENNVDIQHYLKRYAEYYILIAQSAAAAKDAIEGKVWMERLDAEYHHVRAVLIWAVDEKQAELAQTLAGALYRFWLSHSYFSEGSSWATTTLQLPGETTPLAKATALMSAGGLYYSVGKNDQAAYYLEMCQELARRMQHPILLARSLSLLGIIASIKCDYERARILHEESLALAQQSDDMIILASSNNNLALNYLAQGNYLEGRPYFEAALKYLTQAGDRFRQAYTLANLGIVAMWADDWAGSERLSRESVAIGREVDNFVAVSDALGNLGAMYFYQGDLPRAREMLDESLKLTRSIDDRGRLAELLYYLGLVALDAGAPTDDVLKTLHESLAQSIAANVQSMTMRALGAFALVLANGGRLVEAVRLFSAVQTARRTGKVILIHHEERRLNRDLDAWRAQVGVEEFQTAWEAGEKLSLAETVALARQIR